MRKLVQGQQTIKLQICLPVSLHAEVDKMAKKSMTSMGALIRQLIIREFEISRQKDLE
jgi:lauroyl/myristoyl acyltransferase